MRKTGFYWIKPNEKIVQLFKQNLKGISVDWQPALFIEGDGWVILGTSVGFNDNYFSEIDEIAINRKYL